MIIGSSTTSVERENMRDRLWSEYKHIIINMSFACGAQCQHKAVILLSRVSGSDLC